MTRDGAVDSKTFSIPSLLKSRSERATVRPAPRLLVVVGVGESNVTPLPNCPSDPSPQHETEPSSRIAQVCRYPEEMAAAVRPIRRLLVGIGVSASDVPPLPNWQLPPYPQHETEPSSRIAQV